MHSRTKRTLPETLLVHAPIACFAIPFPILLGAAGSLHGGWRVAALVACWWLASGAVMMAVDSRSRSSRYARLVELSKRRGRIVLPRGVTRTLCGIFMSWAVRCRFEAGNQRQMRREWKHE